MKKVAIWGIGNIGSSQLCYDLIRQKYEIVAYCDSNTEGKTVINNIQVFNAKEIRKIINCKGITVIVVAVGLRKMFDEIKQKIYLLGIHIDVLWYIDIRDELELLYLNDMHQHLNYNHYTVEYLKYGTLWIDNIMSEVEFWVNDVAKETGEYHLDYIERISNDAFIKKYNSKMNTEFLCEYLQQINEPAVLDIGGGLAPRFGNTLSDGKIIDITCYDPLAYFYNVINKKYASKEVKRIEFGMFEFMSNFYMKKCDAVIICNALDHCIDPYKSLLQSLSLLKVGGLLFLNHYRAEGLNERYGGLHQWNLDYTLNNEFII